MWKNHSQDNYTNSNKKLTQDITVSMPFLMIQRKKSKQPGRL
jgi:hypothetical protein